MEDREHARMKPPAGVCRRERGPGIRLPSRKGLGFRPAFPPDGVLYLGGSTTKASTGPERLVGGSISILVPR